MSRDLDLLKLAKDRWVTADEAAEALGAQHHGYMRHVMQKLAVRGFLKERERPRVVLENGNKAPGRPAAEFRVSTEWGGLDG